MANDLDELMSKDPLTLTKDDLDNIIAYERKYRAQLAAGIKPKKEKGPTIDISSVLSNLTKKPAASVVKRRV